jgi:hypothetical protein
MREINLAICWAGPAKTSRAISHAAKLRIKTPEKCRMPFPVRGAEGILHDIPGSRISFWKDRLETDGDMGLPSRDILAEC